jgi:hypothetical protein
MPRSSRAHGQSNPGPCRENTRTPVAVPPADNRAETWIGEPKVQTLGAALISWPLFATATTAFSVADRSAAQPLRLAIATQRDYQIKPCHPEGPG